MFIQGFKDLLLCFYSVALDYFNIYFRAVQQLDVSNNQLTALSNQVRKLSSLRTLKANNNNLQSLPQPFGFMRSLKQTDFSNNQLTSLIGRKTMPRGLKELSAKNNNLNSKLWCYIVVKL